MESIKEIFKIGNGPSSSHTIGPRKAANTFKENNPGAARYEVILYGALAATGKGHLTDDAILNQLKPIPTEIIWKPETVLQYHPNGMEFKAFDAESNLLTSKIIYSTGGGFITDGNEVQNEGKQIYQDQNLTQILEWCEKNGRQIWEYVEIHEGSEIWDYLVKVWNVMKDAISRGIENEGVLPGNLNVPRKAQSYFAKAQNYAKSLKRRSLLFAYALAVSEENASGGLIVTAPTCGSSGVLPALLYLLENDDGINEKRIIRSLATAGLIGNIVKRNASISGAKVGCQGEIGTACAMASAAGAQVFGGTPHQIEYAAEMGLEHHLGLTCDPVGGLVQIPCIERNAFGAARAMDSAIYAILSDGRHFVSFDKIVHTMNLTGNDIPPIYRETSLGGLAKVMRHK